jgi:hypothetical protein
MGWHGISTLDLWYPDEVTPPRDPAMVYTFRAYTVMGRLAPGVSRAQAQAEAETIVRRVLPEGQTRAWDQPVRVLSETEYGWDQGGLVMLLVMPVVGLVLLVACANVSGLLLARHEQRRKELALRAALGASRIRLIRQLMTESLILTLAGLGLALPLIYGSVGPVSRMVLSNAAGSVTPSLPVDHRAWIAAFVLALVAGLTAGWLPALRSARTDLAPILKGDLPVLGMGRWRFTGRNLLVMGQLALALVFLAATGLLMMGFQHVLRLDPGFATRELLIVSFYGMHERSDDAIWAYYRELRERFEALARDRSSEPGGHGAVRRCPQQPGANRLGDGPGGKRTRTADSRCEATLWGRITLKRWVSRDRVGERSRRVTGWGVRGWRS